MANKNNKANITLTTRQAKALIACLKLGEQAIASIAYGSKKNSDWEKALKVSSINKEMLQNKF
jgi:hypothetical protein